MKGTFFWYGLVVVFIFTNIACKPETYDYDQESWNNAYRKKQVLDVKREKLAEFSDICDRPRFAHIDNQHLYIHDSKELVVYQYSRKDYRIKSRFGGKGEGPSEFRVIQGIKVYEDFIFVNSPGKNSYFSKEGVLLKEVKSPPHLIPCYPVKNNFVTVEYSMPPAGGHRTPYTEKRIVLVGPDFEKKKTLFQKTLNIAIVFNPETGRNTFTLFPDRGIFRVYKNNIYIGYAHREGFVFAVFDSSGHKLYEINRPCRKRKISGILKKSILKKPYRLHWNNQVLQLKFYEYLPAFSSFEVIDDRIYIFPYPGGDKQLVLILDLKGKLIDSSLIPFDLKYLENSSYQIFTYKKNILNGYSYHLRDNEETGKYELWRKRLIDTDALKK